MIELAPEIFQRSRSGVIAASSVPRHFLIAFFYALLTLPFAHYSRMSDIALSPRNDPSRDLVSSVL